MQPQPNSRYKNHSSVWPLPAVLVTQLLYGLQGAETDCSDDVQCALASSQRSVGLRQCLHVLRHRWRATNDRDVLVTTGSLKVKPRYFLIHMSQCQTRDQKHFTIPEVAADWHRANDTAAHYAMRSSIAVASKQ